jgi:hypothetical protein
MTILICNGICKDGSLCKFKSQITDTNGKHFCGLHFQQGVLEPDCSICMDAISKLPVTVTKCKHVFHTKCLENWTTNFNTNCRNVTSRHTNCPLCRAQIVCKQKQFIVTSSPTHSDLKRKTEILLMEMDAIKKTLWDEYKISYRNPLENV